MGGIYLMAAIILLFIIMGVFLLQGKGSWPIAGYNTASKEEKARYDQRKLCRAMGLFCLYEVVLLTVLTLFCLRVELGRMREQALLPIAFGFVGLTILGVIIMIYYTNFRCKKKG